MTGCTPPRAPENISVSEIERPFRCSFLMICAHLTNAKEDVKREILYYLGTGIVPKVVLSGRQIMRGSDQQFECNRYSLFNVLVLFFVILLFTRLVLDSLKSRDLNLRLSLLGFKCLENSRAI
jgi:hypothetical protein